MSATNQVNTESVTLIDEKGNSIKVDKGDDSWVSKEPPTKQLIFSLYSGDIYEIPIDEFENLDEGQIPIKQRPKSNCAKCYSRGYLYKNSVTSIYQLCNCLIPHVDRSKIKYGTTK